MDGRIEPRSTDGDFEGLDDSQRAEVHEYEGGGPSDGDVLTDMARDGGEDYVEDDIAAEFAPAAMDGDAALSGDAPDVPDEAEPDGDY